MFSVIIPLYNKASHIEKAILSIVAQTFNNFEMIIIDDGSTDESFSKAKEITQSLSSSIKSWRVLTQKNCGVSTTRNTGVKLAKYDYIAFLDADDWWTPDYLESMKLLVEKYPEAGIFASSYYKVKYGKTTPARIGVDECFQDGLINYFQVYAKTLWMPIWTGATIINKDVFEKLNGFNPMLKLGEDFDLWARIAANYPVAFLNKPLAYYNQDVDVNERAVGVRLYKPHEHMLFSTYNQKLMTNSDFLFLYERLALYGLLPYYLKGENQEETMKILLSIHWKWHETKYRLYYKILPVSILRVWFGLKLLLSKIRRKIMICI
ncbi:MAG: glycosyltransferase family A protein [Paludibacter sp.]|nr:glycosyltransferase family A protein [Paludibacter sp.]